MEILTWIAGAVPFLVWLLWWWNEFRYVVLPEKSRAAGAELPPGHMGFPVIGELLSFIWYFKILKRPDGFIDSKRAKYGEGIGMYRTHLFGHPSIISCSPLINKFVLQSDHLFPYRFPTNDLVGPSSLLAAHGDHHKRVKSYIAAAITRPIALRPIALKIQPRVISSLESWAEWGTVVAAHEVKKIVFENIAELFVSAKPGPVLDEISRLYVGLLKGFKAQPLNFPGTTYYRAVQCRRKIMEIFKKELEKRKQEQNGIIPGRDEEDLMDVLMKITDEEGKRLRDEEILDNIVTLFLGGFESTAATATWAVYLLAKNPDILHRLREENKEFRRSKEGNPLVTYDEISQLKYTKKVVEETIRMANITSFVFRSGDHDVEYQGYHIPKGWKVILWVRDLHLNSEYFEDPENFNPDRWDVQIKPEAYQPFGGGSMMCIGTKLVRAELAIFLHHLSLGYRWELINPNAKIGYLPYPMPADGVKIAITKV